MLRFRRPAIALLVLIALWPTLVLGQDRAGVVTTLEGTATVTRPAVAQPVALKFKDDVFLNDRVVTGDRSLARMLLGGRAVVTVRERSALTISEIPGRSTIELTTGKMALAVAREKMRPGDVIEIRTPNAIAGVRGTVVVAEVFQAGAQAGGGGVSVVTRLHVLRGGIDVAQLDPATGRPLTAPQPLNVLQTFSVTGGAPGTITPISQDQVGGITAGLQPSGPQHKAGTNQEHVAAQQMGTAVQLANALSGAGQPLQTNVSDTTPLTSTADQPQDAPLTPLTGGGGGTLTPIAPAPDAPDLRITGTLTLDAGQTLKTFDTDVNRFLTSPMIEIANAMVSQLGPDNLIQVNEEVSVFLASPLLRVIDSTVLPGGDLLRVFGSLFSGSTSALVSLDPTTVTTPGNFITVTGALATAGPLLTDAGGTLTAGGDLVSVLDGGVLLSITPDALLQLNGSTVVVGADGDHTHLFRVAGGFDEQPQVTLAGPLLAAVNADISARGFAFLEVFDGALSSTTTAPLINVSGGSLAFGPGVSPVLIHAGSLDTAGALFKASGADISTPTTPFVSLAGASLTTGGPLLDLTGVTLDLGGQPLVLSSSGSFVTVTGGPVVRLANSTLTADALSTSDGSGNGFDLRGPLLDLTNNSSLTLREIGDEPASSTDVVNVTLAANEPVIRLADSTLTVTGGEDVVTLGVDAGPIPDVQGVTLSATGSTVSVAGALLDLGGVSLVDSHPQLQLTDSTLTQTGPSPLVNSFGLPVSLAGPLLSATGGSITTAGTLLRAGSGSLTSGTADSLIRTQGGVLDVGSHVVRLGSGAGVSLAGPLFTSDGTVITTADTAFGVLDGATLSNTTADALIAITGGSVTTGEPDGGFFAAGGGAAPDISLAGPLLQATDTTLTTGDPATTISSLIFIGDGTSFSSTSTAALLAFHNTDVDAAGPLLAVRPFNTAAAPSVTLAGPLFLATGGSSFNTTSLGLGSIATPGPCCPAFLVSEGATLTSTTTERLIQLTDSTFTAGDAESGGNFFQVLDTAAGGAGAPAPSTVTLAGPLLGAGHSTITTLFSLLRIGNSDLSSTGTKPLLDIGASTLNLGTDDPFNPGTTFGRVLTITASPGTPASLTLAGPLFRAVSSTIQTNDDAFGIFDGASVSSTGTDPLISVHGGSLTAGTEGHFLVLASGLGLPPSLTLAGPLLEATGTTLTNGDPLGTSAFSFISLGDDAALTSDTASPLLVFTSASVNSAGNFFDARRGATVDLAGPLFSASDSTFDVTSLAFSGGACCNGFRLGQGGTLTSTTTAPLIQLDSSTFNAGPDAQSGANFIRITAEGPLSADPQSAAALTLAGPLVSASDSAISALASFLQVERSSVTSTGTAPFISLDEGTVVTAGGVRSDPLAPGTMGFGHLLRISTTSGFDGGTMPASVSLAGPLLSASQASIEVTGGRVIGVFNGAHLASTTTAPLLGIAGGSLTAATGGVAGAGDLLTVGGSLTVAGLLAAVDLAGPLLAASDGASLDVAGSLLRVTEGAQVRVTGSTDPLVSLDGGQHFIAGTGRAMAELSGRGTATTVAVEEGLTLTLGTDQPLQHGGPLLDTAGATVTANQGLRIDRALLEASAPLLRLRAGSEFNTDQDALALSFQAKVTSLGPLVSLNGSMMTVINGSAVTVAGGSFLNVGGDLISLANGSTLSILNGPALSALGGSVVRINGGLLSFTGTGNVVNITNNLCPGSCTTISGIRVALTGGAMASQVSLSGSVIKNLAGNTLNLNANGAVIKVDGTSKVRINGL